MAIGAIDSEAALRAFIQRELGSSDLSVLTRQLQGGADCPRVTALPAAPYDGQVIDYVADAVAGVLWRLRYNAGSASVYRWESIGGTDLMDEQLADETNASVAASTWIAINANDPIVTVPLAGDYDADMHVKLVNNTSGCQIHGGFRVGATDPVVGTNSTADYQSAVGANAHLHLRRRLAGLAASATVAHRYWHNGTNPSSITRGAATLFVRPVRVG